MYFKKLVYIVEIYDKHLLSKYKDQGEDTESIAYLRWAVDKDYYNLILKRILKRNGYNFSATPKYPKQPFELEALTDEKVIQTIEDLGYQILDIVDVNTGLQKAKLLITGNDIRDDKYAAELKISDALLKNYLEDWIEDHLDEIVEQFQEAQDLKDKQNAQNKETLKKPIYGYIAYSSYNGILGFSRNLEDFKEKYGTSGMRYYILYQDDTMSTLTGKSL